MPNTIELSSEQKEFILEAIQGSNILVNACIGSGKTTAIQHLCDFLPVDKSILYLTYNRLLKFDAQDKIKNKNAYVTNYHGFAYEMLHSASIHCGVSDLIQTFIKEKPPIPYFDVLIIDEYQDIDEELSKLLEIVKSSNPNMQLIAVGDIDQKIYDKTTLNVTAFIDSFLGDYKKLEFTNCFRLNADFANILGRVWNKKIQGTNENCTIKYMKVNEVEEYLSKCNVEDIMCLGSRKGLMSELLNRLEKDCSEKFNKKTVYASISDSDSDVQIPRGLKPAIFTTFDSSKGLERPICVIFDFTEDYWDVRVNMPQQSSKILKNIFCVAASRGKKEIIFVNENYPLLSEETLINAKDIKKAPKLVNISEMFDFKYKESVEKCFSHLLCRDISPKDKSTIEIKNHDDLIDLSPCIGIYQEAHFFKNYSIDTAIEFYCMFHKDKFVEIEKIRSKSVEEKILFLTALETRHERYNTQVKIPFVSQESSDQLFTRLNTLFASEEKDTQVLCQIPFYKYFDNFLVAKGRADVVKNDTVYELKYVSELKHEHYLQCASYMVALGLKRGVLWNTRNNQMVEIHIDNEYDFLKDVELTVLKKSVEELKNEEKVIQREEYNKKSYDNIAIIDVETNWHREVMSIGLAIADPNSFEKKETHYFIIDPERQIGGMYIGTLYSCRSCAPIVCSRSEAMKRILSILNSNSIKNIFAYNAAFDYSSLPALSNFDWYDIMKIAAYRDLNPKLPNNLDFSEKSGRLKSNYGVEAILKLLKQDNSYAESHNAANDAEDELLIMQLIGVPISNYILKAKYVPKKVQILGNNNKANVDFTKTYTCTSSTYVSKVDLLGKTEKKKENYVAPQPQKSEKNVIVKEEITIHYDEVTTSEAQDILGVSSSTVYNLIHSGVLDARKEKGRWWISRQSVYDYYEKRKKWMIFLLVLFAAIFIPFIIYLSSLLR